MAQLQRHPVHTGQHRGSEGPQVVGNNDLVLHESAAASLVTARLDPQQRSSSPTSSYLTENETP